MEGQQKNKFVRYSRQLFSTIYDIIRYHLVYFFFFFFFFFLSPSYPHEGSLAWWVGDEPVLFGPPSLPSFPGYFFPFFPPCMSILAHARGMFLSPELWLPFLFIYLFCLGFFRCFSLLQGILV